MFDRDSYGRCGRSSAAVYGYDTSPVVFPAFEVYRYPPCPQERLDSPQFAREVVGLARKAEQAAADMPDRAAEIGAIRRWMEGESELQV